MIEEKKLHRGLVSAGPLLRLVAPEIESGRWLSEGDKRLFRRWRETGHAEFATVDEVFCRLGMVGWFLDAEVYPEYVAVALYAPRGSGGGNPQLNAAKTKCLRGHPLSGGNLRLRPNGRRQCKTCDRLTAGERKRKSEARRAALAG